ncbi:putative bifunctional inhibitor/plant lipid transfer protein/seed storage helical [Medicago truncatula]|uniref:2S albumin seed storage protein (Conglutin / Ara h 6 allergen) n=1 Tax=Medicago truncatula TaxID=3880 RepID=G7IJM9_MEDTR|nr:conglutin delta 2 [Medicago truncatula]AES66899.1 2S albumin seed storage protein (Conglutin / Ara h 6 allergen) [Medicago truncatula]RHN75290.1 putative bifunctional inhibitor/plant lipid transfer protein/seed storage helical [Medicago truncatula]
MARHNIILIATLLAFVLFIAQTTATRKSDRPDERCRRKLQSLNLRHCEEHIMQRIQKEDEDVLRMRGINHHEDLKEKCCDQLNEVNNKECRCNALQEIMENLSDRLEKREMYEMEREIRNLPKRCNIPQSSECDLSFDQY